MQRWVHTFPFACRPSLLPLAHGHRLRPVDQDALGSVEGLEYGPTSLRRHRNRRVARRVRPEIETSTPAGQVDTHRTDFGRLLALRAGVNLAQRGGNLGRRRWIRQLRPLRKLGPVRPACPRIYAGSVLDAEPLNLHLDELCRGFRCPRIEPPHGCQADYCEQGDSIPKVPIPHIPSLHAAAGDRCRLCSAPWVLRPKILDFMTSREAMRHSWLTFSHRLQRRTLERQSITLCIPFPVLARTLDRDATLLRSARPFGHFRRFLAGPHEPRRATERRVKRFITDQASAFSSIALCEKGYNTAS